MFGDVWCALAAVLPQVGDPGAEEHFEGVALTRCKDAVTEDDEATAEHLVDELNVDKGSVGRSSSGVEIRGKDWHAEKS